MIYICIPAYNEEQTVGVVLWKVRQVMTEFRRDYQILVADDASTDSTPDVLAPYARVLPLTIFRNTERRGYAASLEMLLREAVSRSDYPKRDVIITLQGDFTDDPQDLVTLVKQIEAGADLVTGNVLLPDDTARSRRWARRAAEWAAARITWPDGAGDPLSSYRAYRVETLARAIEKQGADRLLSCDGWAANAQLLQAAAPHARRLESADLTQRHERLQRETRFLGWQTFRQVLALARGRAPAHAGASSIEAHSEARTVRSAIHLGAGSSTADAYAARATAGRGQRDARRNGGERQAPRPERTGSRRGSRDPGGAPPGRGSGAASGRQRPPRTGTDAAPRRERGARPAGAAAGAAPQPPGEIDTQQNDAAGATAAPAAGGDATPPPDRKRRSRRGGRRRRSGGEAAAGAAESVGDATVAGEDAAPGAPIGDTSAPAARAANGDAGDGGDDGPAVAGEDGAAPKRKRRSRRGSRGGRRRRTAAAEDGAASDASSDAGQPPAARHDDGNTAERAESGPRDPSPAYESDDAAARRHAS